MTALRRTGRLAAAALLAIVTAAPSAAAPPDEAAYAALVERVIDGHIRPIYHRFAAAADRLDAAVGAACSPGAADLAAARRAFADAAVAFAALQTTRFGPILEDHRLERLAFWPDARGIGLRQVQKLLAEEDPSALAPATLADKSVAVQGLTALEVLLNGTDADAALRPDTYRCGYARAVSASIAAVSADLASDWRAGEPAERLFGAPGPDNPLFATHAEAAGEVIAGIATALEVVADQTLRPVFGADPAAAKPKLAPFWRSGVSMATLAATLRSARDQVEASGAANLLDLDERWIADGIRFEFRMALEAADRIGDPTADAVRDPAARDAARYLETAVRSLKQSVGRDLTAAIGLQQGFNALDGD